MKNIVKGKKRENHNIGSFLSMELLRRLNYFIQNGPVLILIFVLCFQKISSQSINTEFGKNRVQYHDDFSNWWEYETQNFITYWYGKSRNVAISTIQLAEQDHNEIQKLMEHKINDKIEIIVYLDISDLKQSNIGTEETFVNKTGETKIIGNKMFVYFDGNHKNLQQLIREGIARVYFNHMLFGSSFQEIIQNALLMNIPEWFKEGIVSYASSNWDYLIEDELRDVWMTKPSMRDFKKLSTLHPRLAGHSFWFFIEQNYGRSSISNLLYLTKISRGIDNSFLYVFNEDIKQMSKEWENFYSQYFANEKNLFSTTQKGKELSVLKRKAIPVSQLQYNSDGKLLAYIQNNRGKTKIIVKDVKTGKEKKVFSSGFINDFQETDYNYPVLAWHPNKNTLLVCYEQKDILKLRTIYVDQKKHEDHIIPEDIQRIHSLSFINDDEFVFSASINGFSDLILYKYKTRNYEMLTDDFYDDLDVVSCTIQGRQGVLFSSNRIDTENRKTIYDTILPTGKFNIYFLPYENNPDKKLETFANTEIVNRRFPQPIKDRGIVYLTEESGVLNLQIFEAETQKTKFLSNFDRNAIRYHVHPETNKLAVSYYHDGQYKIFEHELSALNPSETPYTHLQNKILENKQFIIPQNPKSDSARAAIPESYFFQSQFEDAPGVTPLQTELITHAPQTKQNVTIQKLFNAPKPIHNFNASRITPANKKFSLQKVTTKFDNDILFEGLESYTGDRQQLLGTPMGFLIRANIKDLFEDYSIDIGTRLPLLLNGSEFFLVFDNKKSLIDKKMAIYRKAQSYNNTDENQPISVAPSRSNKTSLIGLYQWKIPFNIYKSLRITSQIRFDKHIRKSTENVSLLSPAITEQRLSLRCEYIYDNSHEESLNIKFGTRYKIYVEAINNFNVKLIDGFEFDLSKGFTTIVGFDARHYIPLMYRSVLAIRGTGAASFGSDKMLYYIGGMENWLFPSFNTLIPQRNDIDFAYKANIGQMRGFQNNIRNGTSYLLTNVELRVPFMQYLLGKNKGSSFLRNMQITGFFDMGMAWYGTSPYSKKNPLNTVIVESPPIIRLEIEYFKDPAVFGLGYGFRTQVFGYFIKFDYAWGIETGKLQKPMYYITLGQDF